MRIQRKLILEKGRDSTRQKGQVIANFLLDAKRTVFHLKGGWKPEKGY